MLANGDLNGTRVIEGPALAELVFKRGPNARKRWCMDGAKDLRDIARVHGCFHPWKGVGVERRDASKMERVHPHANRTDRRKLQKWRLSLE